MMSQWLYLSGKKNHGNSRWLKKVGWLMILLSQKFVAFRERSTPVMLAEKVRRVSLLDDLTPVGTPARSPSNAIFCVDEPADGLAITF